MGLLLVATAILCVLVGHLFDKTFWFYFGWLLVGGWLGSFT